MRIVDASECSVNACAQFEYKGWIVSMSTILNKSPSGIFVFISNDLCEKACNTVEEAIKFIDEMES